MLCQNFVAAGNRTCPVNFNIGSTGAAINGIGIARSCTRSHGKGKLRHISIVKIPEEANSSIFPIGVNSEGNINLLVDFECGCRLQRLGRIDIDHARHLWGIYILLSGI